MTQVRIGSRGSQLALWQANHIADLLRSAGHSVSIEVIRTTGDRMQDPAFVPPASFDGVSLDSKGIFIKEIEEALAAGRIDLAVHSLKDLPTTIDSRFVLAAIPPRADARDAFVCEAFWALHTLPEGAAIGNQLAAPALPSCCICGQTCALWSCVGISIRGFAGWRKAVPMHWCWRARGSTASVERRLCTSGLRSTS